MKRRILFNVLMVLGLALALTGGVGMHRRAQAQDSGPQAGGPQAGVGTAFTYQGRLLDEGTPLEDTCDFRFSLYDDDWLSPGLVAGPVDRSSVGVSDGYFSTSVDFGAGAFTGEARQMQIQVRCPAGTGTFTALSGMVWLNAAPYAHSLRPGAVIDGSLSYFDGAILNVNNLYDGLLASYGVHGTAQDTGMLGTGGSAGVKGETASTSGKGVHGEATGTSGTNYGVYGETSSATGHGVYGTSPSTNYVYAGVTGVNTGGGTGAGVYGYSVGGFGVHGRATVGTGVYATSPTTGSVGIATSTGKSFGVYGRNASSSGAGVYGESEHAAGTGVRGASVSGLGVEGTSSSGYGVWGYSSGGTGLYGTAAVTGTSGVATGGGATYGVYGRANSLSGRGVYGVGGYYGVYGEGTDPSGLSYGVYGETWSEATSSGGVYGYARDDDNVVHGVQGRSNSHASGASGVYGYAAAGSGTTYGVLGEASSPDGYGVYSDGDAHVEGNLTWKAKTSYLSVPAAAFRPEKNAIDYSNFGASLSHSPGDICHPGGPFNYTPEQWKYFYAPVFLPQNATVKSMALYIRVGDTGTDAEHTNCNTVGTARLLRSDLHGAVTEVAWVEMWGEYDPYEYLDGIDASISNPTVDNSQYSYYLSATVLPLNSTGLLLGVVIRYEITEPY